MARIRLTVEYDGTNYSGWQRQENAVSVQQRLEEALEKLLREPVRVTGASRTDAGVHALGQTVHFDTASRIPPEKYAFALNTMLPDDIRVRASQAAAPDFHARFHARGKIYRYMMFNSPHASALLRSSHAHVMYPLDVALMNAEARAVTGTHDFAAFAASGSVAKDTVRTIYDCRVARSGEEVMLLVHGSGFLYNMVRILAGTLIQVGSGKLERGAIERALSGRSRLALGVTAPAHGLTLMRVFYEDDADQARPCFEEILGRFERP
ncbi:MAG: tRNA pseudouridine(38-40) synthase TruA [Clostridia bacterium]|nr:tRNA pseudouridine(38-40) synthase TruA [Clostridia bacterium]